MRLIISEVDINWMEHNSPPYLAAQAMLKMFPELGRLMQSRLREIGDDDAGTMMQIRVLQHLLEQPITTSELAKRRKVSLQSASVVVQTMVERGWLTREPDPNDRRRALLQVTEEGKQIAHTTYRQLTELIATILSGLAPEELDAAMVFLPALQRIVQAQMTPDMLEEKQTP
jgi:DNA-binding MarR family transcriptional regulator